MSDKSTSKASTEPWVSHVSRSDRELHCPVCKRTSNMPHVFDVRSMRLPNPQLELRHCKECGTRFFPDLDFPEYDYETADSKLATKFYVEQGAGIDILIRPFSYVSGPPVERYLDVGCGYGFALDYATRQLGIDATGFDPSQTGRLGLAALKNDLRTEYLSPDSDVGEKTIDLIITSEVIEHVDDPAAFVHLLAGSLSKDGVLIITTPNADYANTDTPEGTLIPLLSPGYHYAILSPASLKALLHDAGFAHVAVRADDHTLTTAAWNGRRSANLNNDIDRENYKSYLDARRKTVSADSEVQHGLTYRLLKDYINAGQHELGLKIFDEIATAYKKSYDIDLRDPEACIARYPNPEGFVPFARHNPMNLGGVCLMRGMIALNHEEEYDAAEKYFRLSHVFGTRLRQALQQIGADDGETEEFVWRSLLLAILAHARRDGLAAARELRQLLPGGEGADLEFPPPQDLVEETRTVMQTDLENTGQVEALTLLKS